ncbi:MAG: hypothetical protein ABEJ90_04655 [Halobacterium sp.]
MAERCEGCGAEVRLAGGIANIWTTEQQRTEGMTLEFADGTEHFLCFECIEGLPDEPTAGDVAALGEQ